VIIIPITILANKIYKAIDNKILFENFLRMLLLKHGHFDICDDCKNIRIIYEDKLDLEVCPKCGGSGYFEEEKEKKPIKIERPKVKLTGTDGDVLQGIVLMSEIYKIIRENNKKEV